MLHLTVAQFAGVNIVLTLVWLAIAVRILQSEPDAAADRSGVGWRRPRPPLAVVALATPAAAQDTREAQLAAERAEKATRLRPYEPTTLERRIQMAQNALRSERPVYAFIGSAFDGGGLAVGPGYRTQLRRLRHVQRPRRLVGQELQGRRRAARPARHSRTAVSPCSWADTGSTRRR